MPDGLPLDRIGPDCFLSNDEPQVLRLILDELAFRSFDFHARVPYCLQDIANILPVLFYGIRIYEHIVQVDYPTCVDIFYMDLVDPSLECCGCVA